MGEAFLFSVIELDVESRAVQIHGASLVIDSHCDTLKSLLKGFPNPPTPHRSSLGERSDTGHIDIPRLIEGGVRCQVFAVSAERTAYPSLPLRTAMRMLDVFYTECNKNAKTIIPVYDYEGIQNAYRNGRIAAMLSIEGAEPLEGDLGVLRMLYRLGIRMIGLTWYYRNALADGLWESRTKGGLTRFGVSVVEEMERLGMIVDVSHLTDQGFWDLLDVTENPVIASHSNSRVVCDSPRNLTDDQIKALAERGGVLGLNFSSRHVKAENATVKDMVDHVDHIVRLVGADYVGLGSDFDGTRTPPKGLEDASCHPNFTRELVERGYSDHEIKKILGENHLRVFKNILR